ncbi:MAG: AbrB/MazE/SpoVT family DNA-binding domain-containing protein [Magnetococcales bacterium]|nr:AbrB/MazE/SpoVT family DNA-binding domain-containing protein [Magnetococcales bacterium]
MQTTIGTVFINENSQAIRLPSQFRLDTDEVMIAKSGNRLILTPCVHSWDGFVEGFIGFSDDLSVAGGLSTDLPRMTFE